MSGQSMALLAAFLVVIICVLVDTFTSGSTTAVLVPALMLVAALCFAAAARTALRRAR